MPPSHAGDYQELAINAWNTWALGMIAVKERRFITFSN